MRKKLLSKAAAFWGVAVALIALSVLSPHLPDANARIEASAPLPATLSPLRRTGRYDHFLILCRRIQRISDSVVVYERQIANNYNPAARRRFRQLIRQAKRERRQTIPDYNRQAQRAATPGQFRASGLPGALRPGQAGLQCRLGS